VVALPVAPVATQLPLDMPAPPPSVAAPQAVVPSIEAAAPIVAVVPIAPVAPVPPVPAAPPVNLSASLEQAGLVLIETSNSIRPAIESTAPPQQLGRKPKPPQAIPDEPLQMMETRKD